MLKNLPIIPSKNFPKFLPIILFIPIAPPIILFKPGARSRRPRAPGFLKLLWFARRYVCVCVCPPPRPLITSGVIWCDIGRERLVKQVLRLFPAFNYFIRHLPSIKWMGVAILTQHVVSACQRKLR